MCPLNSKFRTSRQFFKQNVQCRQKNKNLLYQHFPPYFFSISSQALFGSSAITNVVIALQCNHKRKCTSLNQSASRNVCIYVIFARYAFFLSCLLLLPTKLVPFYVIPQPWLQTSRILTRPICNENIGLPRALCVLSYP